MGNLFFNKDNGWDKLYTSFETAPGESAVFVGYLRSSGVYKPKKGSKAGAITMAQIAAINEFGSKDGKHPPERSFMRSAIDGSSAMLEKILLKLALKVLEGESTPKKSLGIVGQFVRDRMVAKINSGVPPANAKSTIAKKDSSKPLIDTGQLKGAIEWEIHEGKNISKE